MRTIEETNKMYKDGVIDKATYIERMYTDHHHALYEYASYIANTNIKKIEIESGRVVMTSRDRGIRIACKPGDYRIAPIETLNFKDYEKSESRMMENLVSEGDVFFDVGANIGWYAINLALTSRTIVVHAFEPIPPTFEQLQTNIGLNGMSNVIANNFGLSNEIGQFPFYYYLGGSVNASAANVTGRTDVDVIQCEVTTLDNYVRSKSTRVDFIKCDVEGGELMVFQGGVETLNRDKPIVLSEILRKWSAEFNYNPNEIFALFKSMKYGAYTVENGYLKTFETMTDATLETNFFFLHQAKHKTLIDRYKLST